MNKNEVLFYEDTERKALLNIIDDTDESIKVNESSYKEKSDSKYVYNYFS